MPLHIAGIKALPSASRGMVASSLRGRAPNRGPIQLSGIAAPRLHSQEIANAHPYHGFKRTMHDNPLFKHLASVPTEILRVSSEWKLQAIL